MQLACAPLVSCASREQSHSMLSSFASRILSIGNLMAEIKDPISADMLIGAIDLKVPHQATLRSCADALTIQCEQAMCEAVILCPVKLPEANSAVLVLGNLSHLLKLHQNALPLLGSYAAAMHSLLQATPAGVLQSPTNNGIAESVILALTLCCSPVDLML